MKVFVSGSNSSFLGSEFSTALTGRTITFKVSTLSFKEFLNFRSSMAKTKDQLRAEFERTFLLVIVALVLVVCLGLFIKNKLVNNRA